MSSTTQKVVKDADGVPSPQYYNSVTDIYEPLQGSNGSINVQQLDISTSGTITTQNLNATGAATTGSAVALSGLDNSSTIDIQITANTMSKILTPQVTLDGTNWVALGPTGLINLTTNVQSATIAANATGIWQANIGAECDFRLVETLAVASGSASIVLQSSASVSALALDAPLPAGANLVGSVKLYAGSGNYGFQALQSNLAALPSLLTAPVLVVDKVSAAVTASGSTVVIADDFGQAIASSINVTAVSGTSPTLDVILQESKDNGITWEDIYHCPRFTAIGTYSLEHQIIGGRRRWSYIISGTSPSFTFAINTMRSNLCPNIARSFYDRSFNSSQAVGPSAIEFNISGLKSVTMSILSGAATTLAAFQLQYSSDSVTFYNASDVLITVAGSAVAISSTVGFQAKFARIACNTAGSGQTLNYIHLYGTN
jgi:hypothetical protein